MESLETLEDIFNNLPSDCESRLTSNVVGWIKLIGRRAFEKKGVYTVLATLLYYKHLHPAQDVRLFQTGFPGGFSARSFDTKNVTPVLRKLGLPAMAESGWLTRSLEQPYIYDLNYKGKIAKELKQPFLKTLDYVERNPSRARDCLCILLAEVKAQVANNQIVIYPLEDAESVSISKIIDGLTEHFNAKYSIGGAAKLPVLAFHSIYTILIDEMSRYDGCTLADLSSLTACDRTNKASGDIEIFDSDGNLFEAIEIKLNKKIDAPTVRVVRDKVYKWNPERYYILSVDGLAEESLTEIEQILNEVAQVHGCQIIINGLIPTIRYYLRLIRKTESFIQQYSHAVELDSELKAVHKEKWNEILQSMVVEKE